MIPDERDLIEALRTIESLLQKHGLGDWVDTPAIVAEAEAGIPGIAEKLTGLSVWGGSGALWEINLAFGKLAQPDASHDQRSFQSAIIVLADYLNAHEVGSERMRARAREIAAIFRRWNETIYRA